MNLKAIFDQNVNASGDRRVLCGNIENDPLVGHMNASVHANQRSELRLLATALGFDHRQFFLRLRRKGQGNSPPLFLPALHQLRDVPAQLPGIVPEISAE